MELTLVLLSKKCELGSDICFVCVKRETTMEIHCQLCAVYELDAMPECSVHLWVSCFCDEKTNEHSQWGEKRLAKRGDE